MHTNRPMKMLAFDFGASSGRAILGILADGVLRIEEIHRFENEPIDILGHLHWDFSHLMGKVEKALMLCVQKGHSDIHSIGVDTWGVDFGRLNADGALLENPYHYRDKLTDDAMAQVFEQVLASDVYKGTGIQLMRFNTLYQLHALLTTEDALNEQTETVLMMPDLFNYTLTGQIAAELSIASTTQMLDPQTCSWRNELINRLGIPMKWLPKIVTPGTVVGHLLPHLAEKAGLPCVPVVAVAGHDTQSAIAAVPATEEPFVYISCGTWSLMGVERDTPLLSNAVMADGFTNEIGVDGKITFLKNIMGLWLVQESKRHWEREGEHLTFAQLEQMAWDAPAHQCFIDPADECFMEPGDMPGRIREYCRKTRQTVPESKGAIIRCIAESLALKYRSTLEQLETICGNKLPVIHMVGGGIRDAMLCAFTAYATNRKVIAGPAEATSVGNLLVQAIANGQVESLVHLRQIVKNSFVPIEYLPTDSARWEVAYEQFTRITAHLLQYK